MAIFKFLFLFFTLLNISSCEIFTEAREFEENKITLNNQKFRFKTQNIKYLIIIIVNEYLPEDVDIERKFIIYNTKYSFSHNYDLESFYCYIDEPGDIQNEIEYYIRFKNYKGGYFIIYNSANIFPLKQFEKGYSLYIIYYRSSNITLNFISDILNDDILLDIYPSSLFKIKNVNNNIE